LNASTQSFATGDQFFSDNLTGQQGGKSSRVWCGWRSAAKLQQGAKRALLLTHESKARRLASPDIGRPGSDDKRAFIAFEHVEKFDDTDVINESQGRSRSHSLWNRCL